MKPKIQPTNIETRMADDEIIVSKTDTRGHLIYGNEIFIAISGYQENELLGKQHNIIRHPDMPRGVFKLLWDTLKAGDEFNGYVKNLRKDGGFYWVFANITPCYNTAGDLIGYYSVRRKPKQDALNVIEPIYQQMLAAEQQAGSKDAIASSIAILNNILSDKGVSYDNFICTL